MGHGHIFYVDWKLDSQLLAPDSEYEYNTDDRMSVTIVIDSSRE